MGKRKSTIKKGDVLMCKSGFPDKENLIINFSHYDNEDIVDKDGKHYRISDLKNMYSSFHVMR